MGRVGYLHSDEHSESNRLRERESLLDEAPAPGRAASASEVSQAVGGNEGALPGRPCVLLADAASLASGPSRVARVPPHERAAKNERCGSWAAETKTLMQPIRTALLALACARTARAGRGKIIPSWQKPPDLNKNWLVHGPSGGQRAAWNSICRRYEARIPRNGTTHDVAVIIRSTWHHYCNRVLPSLGTWAAPFAHTRPSRVESDARGCDGGESCVESDARRGPGFDGGDVAATDDAATRRRPPLPEMRRTPRLYERRGDAAATK